MILLLAHAVSGLEEQDGGGGQRALGAMQLKIT